MRVAVVGAGAVGARVARQLLSLATVDEVIIRDERPDVLDTVARTLSDAVIAERPRAMPPRYTDAPEADAVVLATPPGTHAAAARASLEAGSSVVSVSDSVADVEGLLALDGLARERQVTLAVGAGFMPGLSCVLAQHVARDLDRVDEIHVAKVGTGGPSCARQHHKSLSAHGLDYRDGVWQRRRGGSGRELCWFPAPVDAEDCYRAALCDPILLVRSFPQVRRVTARMAATRRDRLTMRLPMLRPPHAEGGVGAVRVEVRGMLDNGHVARVLGATERPAIGAATVAAAAMAQVLNGRTAVGAAGLGELMDPLAFLHELRRRNLRVFFFEGAADV